MQSERRGRPKGLKNKTRPEIGRMLGKETLHYAHARFKEKAADGSFADSLVAGHICFDRSYVKFVKTCVRDTIGNAEKAAGFYELVAEISPEDSTLWKRLCAHFVEKGKIDKAKRCLKKAIRADPSDITRRFHLALLYIELED
ncbi:hypothetical protein QYF36_021334 [Acer negundo]|nr:hypothetical protein QYF36_021334 [Acer negundo]